MAQQDPAGQGSASGAGQGNAEEVKAAGESASHSAQLANPATTSGDIVMTSDMSSLSEDQLAAQEVAMRAMLERYHAELARRANIQPAAANTVQQQPVLQPAANQGVQPPVNQVVQPLVPPHNSRARHVAGYPAGSRANPAMPERYEGDRYASRRRTEERLAKELLAQADSRSKFYAQGDYADAIEHQANLATAESTGSYATTPTKYTSAQQISANDATYGTLLF